MKEQGTAIIYISHRLDEVVALADRCTVLRDGSVVAAVAGAAASRVHDLVEAMTGAMAQEVLADTGGAGEVLLEEARRRPTA